MPHGSASQSGEHNGNYKHGGKGTKLYNVWRAMRKRCSLKTDAHYKRYGGRGISVCEDWQSFLAFKQWANENGYKEGLTIDRIDNNGDYCPENCRWVDRKTQANNLEVTVKIKVIDTEKTLHEWADFLGINPYTLYDRLRAGWPPERALFERVSLNKYEHQKKALEAMKDD